MKNSYLAALESNQKIRQILVQAQKMGQLALGGREHLGSVSHSSLFKRIMYMYMYMYIYSK